jgi:hypothetical protein
MVRVPDVTEAVPELRVHFRTVPIFASVASKAHCPMFSPSIRFQGVQMAARFLAMFSKLGTTRLAQESQESDVRKTYTMNRLRAPMSMTNQQSTPTVTRSPRSQDLKPRDQLPRKVAPGRRPRGGKLTPRVPKSQNPCGYRVVSSMTTPPEC